MSFLLKWIMSFLSFIVSCMLSQFKSPVLIIVEFVISSISFNFEKNPFLFPDNFMDSLSYDRQIEESTWSSKNFRCPVMNYSIHIADATIDQVQYFQHLKGSLLGSNFVASSRENNASSNICCVKFTIIISMDVSILYITQS